MIEIQIKLILILYEEPKPVVEAGPTAEEVKHKKLSEDRAKAWEELVAESKKVPTPGMKIKDVLSFGPD